MSCSRPQRKCLLTFRARIVGLAFLSFVLGHLPTGTLNAQETDDFSPEQIDFFENKVRPLLVDHCLACHGADENKVRGGLLLISREAMLKGGDSGPAIVPGDANESLLIQSVRYEDYEMPPDGKLDPSQIDILVRWIEMGAPDPRSGSATEYHKPIDMQEGRRFWAFQPVRTVVAPESSGESWALTDIDRLIYTSLSDAGLQPVRDADRETLVRRMYLTLIGLPPTLEQIDQFVDDPDSLDRAMEKVIDELLESPHFGERWGRHWLDVVRFAESSGGGRSLMFPDAWRFRDYVVDSYNKDKPFDQFLREQIAGDLLPYETHSQKIEQVIGTGMLALGPTNYEQQDKELLRMEVIDEQVDTIGRAFMGLTLGCARCHDHKFDPIPMTDYYALAGIFGSTLSLVDGNVSKYVERPLATEEELRIEQEYRERVATLTKQLESAKEALKSYGDAPESTAIKKRIASETLDGIVVDDTDAALTGKWTPSKYVARFVDEGYLHDANTSKGEMRVVFSPDIPEGGQYEVRLFYSAGGNRASNVPVTIDHQDGKSTVRINQSLQPPIDNAAISLGVFRFEANNVSRVTVSTDDTDGHVIVDAVQFLLQDSTAKQPEEKAAALDQTGAESDPADEHKSNVSRQERKTRELVDSLDQKLKELKKHAPGPVAVAMSVRDQPEPADGPLLIRGSVRRPGEIVPRGFVTVCCQDNPRPILAKHESGRLQLANWLAGADHPLTARVYVNRIWRHLFGTGIVATPDNFGMMGQRPSHPELLDFLAGQFVRNGWSTKKLIRSIMLSRVYRLSTDDHPEGLDQDISNRLLWRANRRRVDAEVLRDSILFVSGDLDLTPGGLTIRELSQYDLGYEFESVRRSIYVPAFRNSMLDLFEVFDFANPNLVTGHRNTSTLPTQALFLMNSPVVMEQSHKAAVRLLSDDDLPDQMRIERSWRQVLGRPPGQAELKKTLDYLASFADDQEDGSLQAWTSVYHVLFASLDFRYMN